MKDLEFTYTGYFILPNPRSSYEFNDFNEISQR
jgi:hypothetical protein